jgi:hypothetical protein
MVRSGLENRDTLKGVTPFDSTVLRHFKEGWQSG